MNSTKFKEIINNFLLVIRLITFLPLGFFIGVLARLFTKLAFNLGDGWINGSGIWLGVICWGITFTTSFYIKPDLVSSKNFIRSWMVVIGIFLAVTLKNFINPPYENYPIMNDVFKTSIPALVLLWFSRDEKIGLRSFNKKDKREMSNESEVQKYLLKRFDKSSEFNNNNYSEEELQEIKDLLEERFKFQRASFPVRIFKLNYNKFSFGFGLIFFGLLLFPVINIVINILTTFLIGKIIGLIIILLLLIFAIFGFKDSNSSDQFLKGKFLRDESTVIKNCIESLREYNETLREDEEEDFLQN